MRDTKLIVEGNPTAEQARTLTELPSHPLVHRRRRGNCQITFPVASPDLPALLATIGVVEDLGLRTIRLVDHDWVTLAAIAERLGCSREMVRLLSVGKCGPGGFPPPLNPGQATSFYSWYDVATWHRRYRPAGLAAPNPVPIAVNLALRLRQLGPPACPDAWPGLLIPGR